MAGVATTLLEYHILAALTFLYNVTLGRAWEVERLPFPKHRREELPNVLRQDQLLALFQALRSPKYRGSSK